MTTDRSLPDAAVRLVNWRAARYLFGGQVHQLDDLDHLHPTELAGQSPGSSTSDTAGDVG